MHSHRDEDSSSEQTPKAGDLIAGKYVVERVLKRGGMGVVLAARHAELAQPVAIKVLLPELAGDAAMVTRFLREGRAVSSLRSDHVVRVHDVGRLEGGTPYLVMEMLHGSDLDRRVRKGGPLPWQEAVGYVMQVCEALVEAHATGIIHRDLKPSNLFLVELPSGVSTVKVLDFGISKVGGLDVPLNDAHAITTTEAVLGSPTFMAPEQLKSAKYVDARADLWSLGLVLYFLITGKLAFNAETLGAYLVMILQEAATPVRSLRPEVPEELAAVIHRCLEKDPALRFASASDLRAALAPFAPFAAHVSGMYAAARMTGSHAMMPPPIFTGLSPSAPTPVGGLPSSGTPPPSRGAFSSMPTPLGGLPSLATPPPRGWVPSLPTPGSGLLSAQTPPSSRGLMPSSPTPPGGLFSPSAFTPSGHSMSPSTPASGAPLSSVTPTPFTSPTSDAPSGPHALLSPTTEASWTSAGRRAKASGLRWAVVAAVISVIGLIATLVWTTGDSGSPAAAGSSSGAAAAASPSVVATANPALPAATAGPSASAASSVTPEPSGSAAPSGTASAGATVAAGASGASGAPGASGSGTARTKAHPVVPTKRIQGPMETDL